MAFPSEAHIKAFGSLTYHYAQVEVGLQKCLAGMLGINPKVAIILAAPYSALYLRRVVKSVAKEIVWNDGDFERFIGIVGDSKPAGRLRNYIAHSQWVKGARPGSIKPIGLDIRDEKARLYGHMDDEQDWTADEILEMAINLEKLVVRMVQFSQTSGIAFNIARHVDRTKLDASSSLGNSTEDSQN